MTNTPNKSEMKACSNPNRELWREREGDYYADSIHVTATGAVGINCGGSIIVRPLCEWHALASSRPADQVPDMVERVARALQRENRPKNDCRNHDQREADEDASIGAYRELAKAAISALQAVPASGEVRELLLHGTLSMTKRQVIVDFADREMADAFFEALERAAQASGEE